MAATNKSSQANKTFNPENTQFFSVAMLDLAEESPAWVKDARTHLQNKQWPEAQRVIEAGLKKNPRQLDGLLYLAEAHWEQVHAKEAVDALKLAIQAQPKDARPYALLGRYLLLKGLREQAVKFLEQAVALDPQDHRSRKQLDRTRNLIKRGYQKVEATRMLAVPPETPSETDPTAEASNPNAKAPPAPVPVPIAEDRTTEPPRARTATAAPAAVAASDVDRALHALLSANIFELDAARAMTGPRRGGGVTRFLLGALVLLLAVGLGAPAGLLIRKRVAQAKAGTPMDRAFALLREDTPMAYVQAADALDRIGAGAAEYEAAQPLLALALAVRAVDLGGGPSFREQAERALNTAGEPGSPATRSAAALLARHLIGMAGGAPDKKLDADLKEALETRPEDAWLYVVKGRRAEDAGDDATALLAYRAAYVRDPSLPLALHCLARAHARVGDYAEARQLLQTLLSLKPGHVSAIILGLLMSASDGGGAGFFEARAHAALDDKFTGKDEAALMAAALALIATVSKDSADAAPLWERASTLSTAQPFSLWQVARMRLAAGDVDKATDMLARLTEKNDLDVAFHRDAARAGALAALGPEFVRRVRNDFKARSSWPTVRLPLGTIHVHPGQVTPWETSLDARYFPEAELAAAVEGVKDLSPRVQIARIKVAGAVARAQALLSTGNARGARDLMKETAQDNKNDADILHLLARSSAALGERGDAERYAREALELNPQDPRIRLLLASVLLDASDVGGALKELAALEAAGVESARGHALKARALTQKGKTADAQKELVKAQALDPTDPQVALALGRNALAEGRFEDALTAYTGAARGGATDRLLALARTDDAAAPLLARAVADAGELEAGNTLLEKLSRDHPNDAATWFYLGTLQASQKKKADAVSALHRFLELAPGGDSRRAGAEKTLAALGEPVKSSAPEPKKKRRGK